MTDNIDLVLREDLTPEQFAAATDGSKEILTLACAGSGKSRTLAYRIARLIADGADPHGIVAFTFTEKAADSIKLRVAQALEATGLEPLSVGAMYIGTIHAYCQTLFSQIDPAHRQFSVIDENGLKLFLISRYSRVGVHHVRRARGPAARYFVAIKEIARAWTLINDEMVEIKEVVKADPALGQALTNLADLLGESKFLDFSLMIWLATDLLGDGWPAPLQPLQHLMVDEYQDVNPAQAELIRRMHKHSETLFVVGDDDQSIYGWRGADVSSIMGFADEYPSCAQHTLRENFRSTDAIVRVSDAFAAAELGATRMAKNPVASPGPNRGPSDFRNLWFPDRPSEARWVVGRIESLLGTRYVERNGEERGLTPADFAILMRSTRMAESDGSQRHAAFTQALEVAGISYTLEAGGGLLQRPQVSAIRDAFELLRQGSPTRAEAKQVFDGAAFPAFPNASFAEFARTLAEWGPLLHTPQGGARRRVYPQQLLQELLAALGVAHNTFDEGTMHDLGVLSRLLQDVESVYMSIDSADRFGQVLNFISNVGDLGYDTSMTDILRRPDAVTVATVHKMKGLEFPAVFVVDAENRRFPKDNAQYNGWIPAELLGGAIARGAYQSTRFEEARLFYTAITRAERYLYVSGCEMLPGGRQRRRTSSFAQRLVDDEVLTDEHGLPGGLTEAAPARRLDETVVPTSYSQIRYFLRCPRDFLYRNVYGFSPPITEMFGFGTTVHATIGKLHATFTDDAPTKEQAETIARATFHLKHIPPSGDPVNRPGGYERALESTIDMAKSYAAEYAADFTRQRAIEVPFEVPVKDAVISGSIDLLLRVDENENIVDAEVIDFKTMEGGEDPVLDERLEWTELALQVQLYAKAANEVLGENAQTGAVHLLKDGKRINVPVDDEAIAAAVANVEWAVERILASDYPMRPEAAKCAECDFAAFCSKEPEQFQVETTPPPIRLPEGLEAQMALSLSKFTAGPSA